MVFLGIGVGSSSSYPMDESVRIGIAADKAGFDLVSLPEGINGRSAVITAASIAMQTSKVQIAIGILTPYLRHLMSIASDAIALDHLSKGRFLLGLGVPIWKMADYGYTVKSLQPLETMKEAYVILKDLTNGRATSIGSQFFDIPQGIRNIVKPFRENLPIFMGVVNKLLLRLSAEVCDQIQLGAVTNPPYVGWAIEQIRIGAKRANRDVNTIPIQGHVLTCIDNDDPARARAIVKPLLGRYLAVIEDIMFIGTGITSSDLKPIRNAFKEGGMEATAEHVTDKMIDAVGAVGTAEDCIKGLNRFLHTGLNIPILWGPLGENRVQAIQDFGKEVLPHLPIIKDEVVPKSRTG